MTEFFNVVVIGAGASGLMCAAQAGRRKKVLIPDHGPAPGRKILMSGGGRCNFTNRQVRADHFISSNPHFCKSAISRYTSQDFVNMVDRYGISYEERSHGQLFCRDGAVQILDMLLAECRKSKVKITLNTSIKKIEKCDSNEDKNDRIQYRIHTETGVIETTALVIATGGVSMPGVGATPFAYHVARQFNIPVVTPGQVLFHLRCSRKIKKFYNRCLEFQWMQK